MQRESSDLNFERAEACSFFLNKNNNNRIQRLNLSFLQSLHCAANRLQHIHSSGPGAIMCIKRLSCAICRVMCHMVGRDSSAIKFDSFNHTYLSFILLAEPLTNEGGEETGVPGENPWRRASYNATYYSPKIQALSKTRTRTIELVAG